MKHVKTKRPRPVSFSDVSTLAMVAGKEDRISKIIHDGVLKDWVAIGWISLRKATPGDYQKYPEVK